MGRILASIFQFPEYEKQLCLVAGASHFNVTRSVCIRWGDFSVGQPYIILQILSGGPTEHLILKALPVIFKAPVILSILRSVFFSYFYFSEFGVPFIVHGFIAIAIHHIAFMTQDFEILLLRASVKMKTVEHSTP